MIFFYWFNKVTLKELQINNCLGSRVEKHYVYNEVVNLVNKMDAFVFGWMQKGAHKLGAWTYLRAPFYIKKKKKKRQKYKIYPLKFY